MRTIHVLRIAGPDTEALARYYHRERDRIHAAPPDPKRPDAYADFNLFTRSCSTIIRDGLRAAGYTKISGIFPRDLFVNAAYFFLTQPPASCIRAQRFSLRQLSVPEAAPSVMPPLLNPQRCRERRMPQLRTPKSCGGVYGFASLIPPCKAVQVIDNRNRSVWKLPH